MTSIRRLKKLNRLMPGLLASALVILLMQLHAWTPLEQTVQTQMMRWRGAMPWDSHLVMIKIDRKTLDALGKFPLSYDYYAQLIRRLQQDKTSTIAFNLLFPDNAATGNLSASGFPGKVNLDEVNNANAQLATAMAAHGRVVIEQALGQDEAPIPPVPILAQTAIAMGHLRLESDPDGMTRWVDITLGKEKVPALGIAAVQAYSLEDELVSIPSDMERLQINWPGPATSLAALSLIDVLNGEVPLGFLAGKVAIVGHGAAPGKTELHTPFDRQTPVVGGYMHAAVIHNLLQQNWLRSPADSSVILLLLLGGAALSSLLYQHRILVKLATGAGLAAIWLLICLVALHLNYLLPVVAPIMTIAFVGAAVILLGRLQSSAMLEVRSAFLNTISHEIRTPLNAIVNLAEMLQETPLDDRQREFTDSLHNSSRTLLALINDILDLSKIESEQLAIEDYPVKLSEIVERSLEMLAPRAAEKGIELMYALTPQTPAVVMSDPIRLQQILINLLSNAVKFTESGEISVEVEALPRLPQNTWQTRLLDALRLDVLWLSALRRRLVYQLRQFFRRQSKQQIRTGSAAFVPNAGQFMASSERACDNSFYEIRFAVRDTGIGIPSDRMSELFKPFSQVSPSTTREYGGTGLGLAISQRLSDRLGGRLWVKSQLGKGSTFYFTIRSYVAQANPDLPKDLTGLSGTRLLLIDRNPVRSDRLAWDLTPFGIHLERAASLSAALSLIRAFVQASAADESPFDAIILDESMAAPGDGYSRSIEVLRQAAGNLALPIVLLSTLRNDVPHISNTTVLWKPIKQSSLHQALRFLQADDADNLYVDNLHLDSLPGSELLALPGKLSSASASVAFDQSPN